MTEFIHHMFSQESPLLNKICDWKFEEFPEGALPKAFTVPCCYVNHYVMETSFVVCMIVLVQDSWIHQLLGSLALAKSSGSYSTDHSHFTGDSIES